MASESSAVETICEDIFSLMCLFKSWAAEFYSVKSKAPISLTSPMVLELSQLKILRILKIEIEKKHRTRIPCSGANALEKLCKTCLGLCVHCLLMLGILHTKTLTGSV